MSKPSVDSNVKTAILDMAKELAKVFKKYTKNTREAAWGHLTSSEGKKEIQKLLVDPSRQPNTFTKLTSFKEWKEENG